MRHRREPLRRAAPTTRGWRTSPTFKPGYVQDLRRVLDDKDVDAILVATPNHWHALATIWGLQAGKHVFVEKPASHTVWEGRKMFEASRKYNSLVQVGTMNRSRPIVQDAIKFIRDGGIGEIYMARGLCFKARPNIGKYPDGPMQPGEKYKLNVEAKDYEPTYDSAYLAKVDYDMWLGPAPLRPFNRNRFHYNWHWHWDYGNGDTGNQGPHQFDIARWGLDEHVHPVKISSGGGLFDARGSSQETPDVHTTVFTYADGKVLEFATRGIHTNDEGTQKIGNLFYGSKGWVWIDGDGTGWQSYLGRKDEKGPGGSAAAGQGSDPNVPTSIEYPHYQNFVDAIRAGDRTKLTCRDRGGPPVRVAPPPRQHRLPGRAHAQLRHHGREVQGRQGSGRAPDPDVPRGLRDQGQGLGLGLFGGHGWRSSPPVARPRRPGTPRPR